MDKEQAKAILNAGSTAEGCSASQYEEALALARADEALGLWLAEQQTLDQAVGAALRSIQPPAHLKDAILAVGHTGVKVRALRRRRAVYGLLALTAVLAVVIGPAMQRISGPGLIETSVLTARIEQLKGELPGALGEINPDVKHLRQWLARRGAADDFEIPSGLAGKSSVGCQVLNINGNKVTLVCFKLDDKRVIHYLVMDRRRMANPPPLLKPVFTQENGAAFAMWSDQNRSYVLVEFSDHNQLQQLL